MVYHAYAFTYIYLITRIRIFCSYGSMLHIQKRYNFGFHETDNAHSALVDGKIVEFTSYPGSIYSQDDFYKITKRSAKTETIVAGTEIQNNNRQLWEKIMTRSDQVKIISILFLKK